MGELSFFDKIYCKIKGIDLDDVVDVQKYYGTNTVIFVKKKE